MREARFVVPWKRKYWEKSRETSKIEPSFPSMAQFELSVQHFSSAFTQNPQPVDRQIHTCLINKYEVFDIDCL
jgi:hypothetical protein